MQNIPLIDLNNRQPLAPTEGLSTGITRALNEFGFLYIKNHGVPKALTEELEKVSREFFSQDEAEKLKIRMENGGLSWRGYFPLGKEYTSGQPDQKEGLYFGTELNSDHPAVIAKTPMHGSNQWPNQKFKDVVERYLLEMQQLGEFLLQQISLGIGLQRDYFKNRYQENATQLFRIFAYPPSKEKWGVQEHTDMGFLTILLQDSLGGLEVKTKQGWISAPPIPGTFVVNIGDILELWTRGILKATLHRVKNTTGKLRLSFPYFYDPAWDSTLEKIPEKSLDPTLLNQSESNAESRWDMLDLHQIDKSTTYGQFVWQKISKVFPHLVPHSE